MGPKMSPKKNEDTIVFLRKVCMDIILNEIEVRVLGSLMEKTLSTRDYYPLSLIALTNACNQKSSGDTNIAEPEEASTLSVAAPVSAERIEKLELAVESLQNEIEDLKKSFRTFIEQKTSK
jgi:uncharacterized protein YceH (UPF0502 family)